MKRFARSTTSTDKGRIRSRECGGAIRNGASGSRVSGTSMTIGGGRVLVIEDDEGMREAIESLLNAAGYATSSYASAEALIAVGTPDDARCIVSDIRLPAMSGLELITELRARGAGLPVILITAHDSAALRSEAGRRGAAAYLAKPFARCALLAAIEGAVQ